MHHKWQSFTDCSKMHTYRERIFVSSACIPTTKVKKRIRLKQL